jgi:pyruvate formate lyase activating enzyme
MAGFISELPGKNPEINVLPYHNIAVNKYKKLGSEYQAFSMEEPTEQEQQRAVEIFRKYGLKAEIGG